MSFVPEPPTYAEWFNSLTAEEKRECLDQAGRECGRGQSIIERMRELLCQKYNEMLKCCNEYPGPAATVGNLDAYGPILTEPMMRELFNRVRSSMGIRPQHLNRETMNYGHTIEIPRRGNRLEAFELEHGRPPIGEFEFRDILHDIQEDQGVEFNGRRYIVPATHREEPNLNGDVIPLRTITNSPLFRSTEGGVVHYRRLSDITIELSDELGQVRNIQRRADGTARAPDAA